MTEIRDPASRVRAGRPEGGRLEGAVAFVACASREIGGAVAVALAAEGAAVALGAEDTAAIDGVALEIIASGGQAAAFALHRKAAGIQAVASAVEEELGPLSVLVNATGAPLDAVATERLPLADYDEIIATQLKTPFLVTREIGRRMLDRGAGAIVNVASIGGIVALPQSAAFAAASAGLFSLTRVCAVEWADRGVRVNAVAAGFVGGDHDSGGVNANGNDRAASTPMQRLARPSEIAGATVFLSSADASYITGETLVVDGGWVAR